MKIVAIPFVGHTPADAARVGTHSIIAEVEHYATTIAGGIPVAGRIFWIALILAYMAVAFGVIA